MRLRVLILMIENSHIRIIYGPPISFADSERWQYWYVWNDSDYTEFSGLWNSNAFRRLKKGGLGKNANILTGQRARI